MGEILEAVHGVVAGVVSIAVLGLLLRGVVALPEDMRTLARKRQARRIERRLAALAPPLRALEPSRPIIGRIGPGGRR